MDSILGTVPTSDGLRRYFQPSHLPGPDDLPGTDWRDLCTTYHGEYADLQKVKDKSARVAREAREAEDYPRQAAQAKREGGKVPKDPRPGMADRVAEAAAELEVQEQVLVDLSEEIEAWRKANADDLVVIPYAIRDECGERGPRVVAEAAEMFDTFNATLRTEAWILGRKPPAPKGSKIVNDLEREVRDVMTPPRTVYLRQAERRKLANEQDAVDVECNALPFAETDKAVREGSIRLVIAHGSPRSVQDLRAQYGLQRVSSTPARVRFLPCRTPVPL
jgi:hypothetical protein